jgi:hypothetical protein
MGSPGGPDSESNSAASIESESFDVSEDAASDAADSATSRAIEAPDPASTHEPPAVSADHGRSDDEQ